MVKRVGEVVPSKRLTLQEPAQKAWAGRLENAGASQAAMKKRARLNGLARSGDYTPMMENEG